MCKNKTVAVVVPAFNEESQISRVIQSMPSFVDHIVIVNDCSTDRTGDIVKELINREPSLDRDIPEPETSEEVGFYGQADIVLRRLLEQEHQSLTPHVVWSGGPPNSRIILIECHRNGGVGSAIAVGYKWCRDRKIACTAVMAGDGQMDPSELESICRPVIEDHVDYVKGNRLIHRSAWIVIPRSRFLGNAILSMMTKIASGYWRVSDTQCGYTAISLAALRAIRLHRIYPSYGMPNDLLVKLNIAMCTLREVPIKPVYNVGERSKLKIGKVIPRISALLLRGFIRRLWEKHLFRDFHPLFLLYHLSIVLAFINIHFSIDIIRNFLRIGPVTDKSILIFFVFFFITSFQSLMFAMWMDIQNNDHLHR